VRACPRHRPVLGVDDLGDDQILEEVHAGVLAAFGGYAGGLGCTVDVEWPAAPGGDGQPSAGIGQDLRGTEKTAG
jgi:hypothetical protein